MTILQVVGAAANFVTLVMLARLLTPRDFGVAAIAALVAAFVATFGDFGLGPAVIQRTTEVEKALYTANTLRAAVTTSMFGITIVIAAVAAGVFSAPEATDPIRVVSILFLLNGALFIPQTRLTKEMKFGIILKAALVSSLVSAAVSIGMAALGFGYWTIIIASLIAATVNLGVLWFLAPWRIALVYDARIARELLAYGKHLFLTTIFTFFVLNIDNAGVAILLGPVFLGYYALAFKWANVPVNFLSKVAAQVMTPAYVMLRDAPDRLRKAYLETVQLITVVSLPVYLGLFVLADEFVTFALGSDWLPIVAPMRILCLMGIFRGIAEPGGYLFMATGDSRLVSISTGLHLLFLGVLILPGLVLAGISGAAWAVAIAYAANLAIVQHFVRVLLGVSWKTMGRLLRNLLPAGVSMVLIMLALKVTFAPSVVLFLVAVGVGLAAYLVVIRVLEGDLMARYIRQILQARRGA